MESQKLEKDILQETVIKKDIRENVEENIKKGKEKDKALESKDV